MAKALPWQTYHEAVERCLASYSVGQLRVVARSLAARIVPQDRAAVVEYLTHVLDTKDVNTLDDEEDIGPGLE